MKRYLAALACAAVLLSAFGQEDSYDYVEYDYEHWSFSTQATLVLPQGGAKLHRLGGATVRVGYYVELREKGGSLKWLWVSMDAFTDDIGKIAIPTRASGAFFDQLVSNLVIRSNHPGVAHRRASPA